MMMNMLMLGLFFWFFWVKLRRIEKDEMNVVVERDERCSFILVHVAVSQLIIFFKKSQLSFFFCVWSKWTNLTSETKLTNKFYSKKFFRICS